MHHFARLFCPVQLTKWSCLDNPNKLMHQKLVETKLPSLPWRRSTGFFFFLPLLKNAKFLLIEEDAWNSEGSKRRNRGISRRKGAERAPARTWTNAEPRKRRPAAGGAADLAGPPQPPLSLCPSGVRRRTNQTPPTSQHVTPAAGLWSPESWSLPLLVALGVLVRESSCGWWRDGGGGERGYGVG